MVRSDGVEFRLIWNGDLRIHVSIVAPDLDFSPAREYLPANYLSGGGENMQQEETEELIGKLGVTILGKCDEQEVVSGIIVDTSTSTL